MTKEKIYGKMIVMKKIVSRRCFIALIALSISLFFAAAVLPRADAFADEESSSRAVLPYDELEYTALSSPRDACYISGNYAVIEGQTIRVFPKNGESYVISDFRSLKQIKFFNENTLFASDDGSVYSFDLSGETPVKTRVAGGSFFDFNNDYLITVYGNKLTVYNMADKSVYDDSVEIANDVYPIAINSNNEIFYHSGSSYIKMFKYEIRTKQNAEHADVSLAPPSKMIANDLCIYFVSAGGVYYLPAKNAEKAEKFSVPPCEFDLGNVLAPEGLSFKGENLLVTDYAQSAVQEFRTDGNTLVFTGFAITSGKTAYNRIGKTAYDVQRYGNKVAVLDANKLTVINAGNGGDDFDRYSEDNFVNMLMAEEKRPAFFALGESTVLTSDNAASSIKGYGEISETAEPVSISGIENTIKSVCYQSGYYYVLSTDSLSSYVYKISEKGFEFSGEPITFYGVFSADRMCADVYGNVYIADANFVYKNSSADRFPCAGAKKIAADLAGVLYGVSDGQIKYYKPTGSGESGEWVTAADLEQTNIKSFGLYFDKTDVYFVTEGTEFLYKTDALRNVAIDSATVPENFLDRTAAKASEEKTELEYYTVKDGANLYYANHAGEKFTFLGIAEKENEYILVGKAAVNDATGKTLTLYALAAQNGVVLADASLTEKSDKNFDTALQKAYTATNVNLYHLPIITENDAFTALINGKTLRLNKGTVILPQSKTEFLGIDYYYVSVTYAGESYCGFIPLSFTVETLYENPDKDEYTLKTVSSAKIYSDEKLTEELAELENGTSVRVYSIKDGVAKIAYETAEGYVFGYIDAKRIKDEANLAVRNILISLAVITSVCGTATYFILRKKSE